MKKIYKIVFLIIVSTFYFLSCSKEDEDSSVIIEGDEVYQSQFVKVTLPNTNLSQDEYQAKFDGVDVILSKIKDNELLFLVPNNSSLGLKELIIPSLNNTTIHYVVKEAVLSKSPEEIMDSFFTNLNTFSQTLNDTQEATSVQNALNSFDAIFDNASLEERKKMAVLYQSNKVLFDDIILNNFSSVSGRNVEPSDIQLLAKHSMAVYVMAAGAIVAIVAPDAAGKALGVVLVAAGAYKAREYFLQVVTKKLNTLNCVVNGLVGLSNRSANETFLTFQSDIVSTVSLEAKVRGLITADATKNQSAVVSFFKDYNKYNYYINKVNSIITWVNNNILFADFNQISLEQLTSSSAEEIINIDSEEFSNFTFSVNHPNLQLVSSSIESDGQLNVKIKIIDTPISLPVESFLYYTYSDEFSQFSGKLPIKVSNGEVNTNVVQFILDGNSYNATLVSTQYSSATYCPLRLVYENDELYIRVIISIGNFESQPIGTLYQFQSNSPFLTGASYTPCLGNYTHMTITFYDDQWSAIYPWRESLFGRGTLTKTGINNFTFSGEFGSIESNPTTNIYFINETVTKQISGLGEY